MSLLIDQRSASLSPGVDEIRAWASGRRVFVSSLITDMPDERAAARQAISEFGAVPVMFEDNLGAQDITAEQAYLAGVRSSEVYVGLWGSRYGVKMPDGYSATHAEFKAAEELGLRLCLFVNSHASGDMDGEQRDLVASARNFYTTADWNDPADLGRGIARRLTELAAEDLVPWVRIGRVVLRATDISADGSIYTVVADVRDPTVHAELLRLRNGHRERIPFAAPGEARAVSVESVSTRTRSTARHEDTVVMRADSSGGNASMRVTAQGLSWEESSRRALSDGLFGTSLQNVDARWGRPATVDPLASLRGRQLDDAVVRPVARLLLTEHLFSTGSAATIDHFALGPRHNGRRRLNLIWTPPARYINSPEPQPLEIDGETTGI